MSRIDRLASVAASGDDEAQIFDARPAPEPRSSRPQDGVGRGLRVLGSSRVLTQIIQFGSSIWLARLLTPADYGTFAVIMTVAAFAGLLNTFGLTEALVRQATLSRWHVDAAFWLNAFSGLLLVAVGAAISPLLAVLFDEPRLLYLFPLASLLFVISTNVVQFGILQRHRRFALMAATEVVNSLVVVTVTTALALLGTGVISLVAGLLSGALVVTGMLWREVHWWPGRPRRRPMVIMLRSSSGNVGFSMMGMVGNSVDTYSVGLATNTAVLGAYNRAYNLSVVPTTVVDGVLNRVLLPVFADLRDDLEQLSTTWMAYARRTLLVLAPGAAFLSVFSGPLVATLYGQRWASSGDYLGFLAWVIPAAALAGTLSPFLFLIARQRMVAGVGVAQALIFVAAIGIGVTAGVQGIVIGVLTASYLGRLPLIVTCLRLAHISARTVRDALLAPLLATALTTVFLVGTRRELDGPGSLLAGAVITVVCTALSLVASEPRHAVVSAADRLLIRLGRNTSQATHRNSGRS